MTAPRAGDPLVARPAGLPAPTGWLVALVAVAALSTLWWGGGLAVLLEVALAGAWSVDAWLARRPPVVRRSTATEVARGVRVPYRAEAVAGRASQVRVRQPQTGDVRVDPPEAVGGIDGTLVVLSRGVHSLAPVSTRSTGPLRLARRDHVHGFDVTIASHADLPGARRLAAAVRSGRFKDPGRRRGPLGLGTDFESIRDYGHDDDIRRVNWAATERVGRPMVNQYREDTERDLWCLVDAGRLSSAPVEDRTRLDAALDAMAAVAAVADVVGDRVGAVAFDDQVRRTIRPRRASASSLTRAFDDLQPRLVDSDYEAAFAQVAGAKRALVVVFTDVLDATAARPLLDAVPILARRHAVLVAGVRDPDLVAMVTTPPADRIALLQAGVATTLLAERDTVLARLRAAGAMVVEAPPQRLARDCVSSYLRLKSLARL